MEEGKGDILRWRDEVEEENGYIVGGRVRWKNGRDKYGEGG